MDTEYDCEAFPCTDGGMTGTLSCTPLLSHTATHFDWTTKTLSGGENKEGEKCLPYQRRSISHRLEQPKALPFLP